MVAHGHQLAEQRSLALHAAVANVLRREPARVERARARVRDWQADRRVHPHYADAWAKLLDLPLDELCAALVDPSQRMRDLRQASPFAGFLDPRERWRILAEINERAGS